MFKTINSNHILMLESPNLCLGQEFILSHKHVRAVLCTFFMLSDILQHLAL